MEETLRVREDKIALKYFRIVKEGNVDVYFRKGKRYTGMVEMTTKDNVVTGTGKIVDGYKEGEWKFFYPNGKYLGLVKLRSIMKMDNWNLKGNIKTTGKLGNGNGLMKAEILLMPKLMMELRLKNQIV